MFNIQNSTCITASISYSVLLGTHTDVSGLELSRTTLWRSVKSHYCSSFAFCLSCGEGEHRQEPYPTFKFLLPPDSEFAPLFSPHRRSH